MGICAILIWPCPAAVFLPLSFFQSHLSTWAEQVADGEKWQVHAGARPGLGAGHAGCKSCLLLTC